MIGGTTYLVEFDGSAAFYYRTVCVYRLRSNGDADWGRCVYREALADGPGDPALEVYERLKRVKNLEDIIMEELL